VEVTNLSSLDVSALRNDLIELCHSSRLDGASQKSELTYASRLNIISMLPTSSLMELERAVESMYPVLFSSAALSDGNIPSSLEESRLVITVGFEEQSAAELFMCTVEESIVGGEIVRAFLEKSEVRLDTLSDSSDKGRMISIATINSDTPFTAQVSDSTTNVSCGNGIFISSSSDRIALQSSADCITDSIRIQDAKLNSNHQLSICAKEFVPAFSEKSALVGGKLPIEGPSGRQSSSMQSLKSRKESKTEPNKLGIPPVSIKKDGSDISVSVSPVIVKYTKDTVQLKYGEVLGIDKQPKHSPATPFVGVPVSTPEIDLVLVSMIQTLEHLQRRALERDPVHGKLKERFVKGLKQSTNVVKSSRARLVLVALDTEVSETLDGKLGDMITFAKEREIPVLMCLSRRRLGKASGSTFRQSAIAIIDPDGSYPEFKRVILFFEELAKASCN
jgi:ribosomal protein L7Ae-like RNA K-turn-binding protein